MRKTSRYVLCAGLSLMLVFTILAVSVTSLDDPVSAWLRAGTEKHLNSYISHLTGKAREDRLNFVDKAMLHTGGLAGISVCRLIYPEGAQILYHYMYGNGDTLELSSGYFEESDYLKQRIKELGSGEHGPIGFRQSLDWLLSMAFNPYYLSISNKSIKVYHPKLEFAPLDSMNVPTIIRMGKMKLRVYDNLVSAMNPTPFYVYSEWEVD